MRTVIAADDKEETVLEETRDGFYSSSSPVAGGYRAEMDVAERASRDEMMALQTKRLAASLAHAYENVAHYDRR